ncbi:hypothetical protein ACTXT7_013206 [Hymenolepis weldensis]
MSRHRRVQRLYSDDYCDYETIIPSSVEEDSPISQHIFQSSDANHSFQLVTPPTNQPLNFTESDFPEVSVDENKDSENQIGSDNAGDIVGELDNLNLDSTGDVFLLGDESTTSGFDQMQELDIETLLNITKTPVSPDYVKLESKPSIEKPNYRPELDSLIKIEKDETAVQSAPELLKAPSKLGVLFNQSRSLVLSDDSQFNSLLTQVHRPLSVVFLHSPPHYCTVFKFDTERPLVFDNPPQSKPAVPPLPKPRLASKAQSMGQKVQGASSKGSITDAETPIRGIRLPKVASEAKVVIPPNKPPDRSALLKAYEEKMVSGKEKEIINLVVVGHVDAGKSTLMGNVLLQLGLVSDKKFEKYKWEAMKQGRSSFAYAWILDQTSEERSRGITMDIAQSAFETKTKRRRKDGMMDQKALNGYSCNDHESHPAWGFGRSICLEFSFQVKWVKIKFRILISMQYSTRVILLDAPGHRDFIPQVIGGAACADVAILVVNATHGEYETGLDKAGGQTQEHARLMRLLGISRIIVAVNKMDTVDWSQARFEEICESMTAILKSINQTDNIFCPVSGLQGINVVPEVNPDENRDMKKIAPWYNGPTLLEIIDGLEKVDRQIDSPFRFLVSDIFKTVGSAVPIIAGRVVSGAISSGGSHLPPSKVVCLPSGKTATIRSIRPLSTAVEIESGILKEQQAYAFAGDQVGLTLTDVDKTFTPSPGDVICDVDSRLAPVAKRIRAKVLVFDVSVPLTLGSPVNFHHFCSNVPARITKLLSATIKKKEVIKPRVLPGRCTAEIEVTLETPVCVELFDVCKPLGRFILRAGHESVAGGTITGILLIELDYGQGVCKKEGTYWDLSSGGTMIQFDDASFLSFIRQISRNERYASVRICSEWHL